ncbi:MAG TPA: YafY family protein [Acidimicrobiia bacterium]|nr:YafY family protein [Acidimicrobiia bacterium]
MRADRLLTALLVLQAKGKVTAAELAAELEVSVKTARRDLEALAASGVPVYSRPGRNGGWELVGGARTDLSGLTEAEAKALFFLVGPAAELSPAAKTALRKLVQALPAPFRDAARTSSTSVVIDSAAWGGRASAHEPRHLDALRHAIVARRRVELEYGDRGGRASTRVVSPLGVVKKGATWYLLADTDAGQRTFRVGRVRGVTVTDEPVVVHDDFDLAAEWDRVAENVNELRRTMRGHLRVGRAELTPLRYQFGDDLEVGAERADGHFDVTIAGTGATMLAQQLAGWGTAVEVVGPESLRRELVRIGRELVSRDHAR